MMFSLSKILLLCKQIVVKKSPFIKNLRKFSDIYANFHSIDRVFKGPFDSKDMLVSNFTSPEMLGQL